MKFITLDFLKLIFEKKKNFGKKKKNSYPCQEELEKIYN